MGKLGRGADFSFKSGERFWIGGLAGASLASALSWIAVAGASLISTTFGV